MRPFEVALVVANFLTLVVLAVPRFRAIWWTEFMILITVAVTVVQILVEGARWQLVPTYVLPGVFVLVWALPHVTPADAILKQILNRPGVAGGIVIICLLDLALSAALPTALPVFHFPAPSGPYQIGTVIYHWVDRSRHELFSSDPRAYCQRRDRICQNRRREVVVPLHHEDATATAVGRRAARSFIR